MKTGKKIAVGLAAALAVAIFAAGAVSMVGAIVVPLEYRVVVLEGPDVGIEIGVGGGDFGEQSIGDVTRLSESLVLTNNGETTAKVEASFTTYLEEETVKTYGLVLDDDEVIPASCFELGTTQEEVALSDEGTAEDLCEPNYVPAQGGTKRYDVVISIPENQPAGIYLGMIELIISAA
jgi:hypothetical protein